MQIIYNENPFLTKIQLDEFEKKEFWYKIKIQMLEDDLFSTNLYLSNPDMKNLDKAKASCKFTKYYKENGETISKIDTYCNHYLNHYLEALDDEHYGDCICCACACTKCQAEKYLNIDTLPNLDKYMGNHIYQEFKKSETKSIDEVLKNLENPTFEKGKSWESSSQEEFDKHIPKWKKESQHAFEWLLNYKKIYLKK
jgi:tRNA G10  N-methylase Trm11